MQTKRVLLIVAHPDDEILWAGGTLLLHPSWNCFVVCLTRKNDADRVPKFYKVLKQLNAKGVMGDLDDEPEQYPLGAEEVEQHILNLLPQRVFDLVITHDPKGEYTRHKRHEEIGSAVIRLWEKDELNTDLLWTFAYEDGQGSYLPKADRNVSNYINLPKEIWNRKYKMINEVYGFTSECWEARVTPRSEAFRVYFDWQEAKKRLM